MVYLLSIFPLQIDSDALQHKICNNSLVKYMCTESTHCLGNIQYWHSIWVDCSISSNLYIKVLIIWDLAEEKSAKFVKIQIVIMMKISRKSSFQDGGKV